MNKLQKNEFDAIIIGSGTCGATIARELIRQQKRVLILEQGGNISLRESFVGIASIAKEVPVGTKMKAMRAITTGGSTGIYFGVANFPPLDEFRKLGIDLSHALKEAKKELPLAELPDELLGDQVIRLRESAMELGHTMINNSMLIDQSLCSSGYSFEAKWKAKSFVEEAVKEGAFLVNHARVLKVIVEKKKAIGVEYRLKRGIAGSSLCRAYGSKIILAAGSLSSPKILRDSGLKDIASRGFYYEPGFAMFGIVPGLKGKNNFMGSMGTEYSDGIAIGDANLSRTFYRLMMLASLKFKHLVSFPESIGVGVKIKDALGGELREDGRYCKQLTKEDTQRLKKGEESAMKILKKAGAKNIFNSGVTSAGHVGGLVRIKHDVNEKLETKFRNLHVCDGSVLPENIRLAPTLTLICLGKYVAKHLLSSL